MQLTNRGPTELAYAVTDERVSSGLPRLDNMLRGGYYRGSNVLISGAPGTAKSTLAGLFAAAACERGERTLYVSFDEGAAQIVRNLQSVGIQLAPHLKSGLLQDVLDAHARAEHRGPVRRAARARCASTSPRCLVIDPLSALSTKVAHLASADAAQQFLDFLKVAGITVVNTSLMDGLSTDEATATGISTIADTWIHVSYVVQDGERNRALTIVKSRGTGHSNQVRELTLSDDGVDADRRLRRAGQGADGRGPLGVGAGGAGRERSASRSRRSSSGCSCSSRRPKPPRASRSSRRRWRRAAPRSRVLADATGSASKLLRTDRAVLRKMRHADEDGRVASAHGAQQGRALETRRPGERASMAKAAQTEARLRAAPLRRRQRAQLGARDRQRQGDLRRALRRAPRRSRSSTCSSDPRRALADGIIVTPTLLKLSPLPVQRVIGNLSDTDQVLLALASG